MASGSRPYFPMYVKDFAADQTVIAMTTEQVGAYILLLCMAWLETPAGSIPDDDATLAKWARMSPKRWAAVKSGVLAAFQPPVGGRRIQKRMTEEAAKIATKSESAKRSAELSWQARRSCERNANASSLAMRTQCEGNARAYESESGYGSEPSLSKTEHHSTDRGGGAGGGGGDPEFDSTPAGLAQAWCFLYRGPAGQQRNPYKVAEEFTEWIAKLRVDSQRILNEIQRADRDRSEPTWAMKERLAPSKKPEGKKRESMRYDPVRDAGK